jgi:hypothetical protein
MAILEPDASRFSVPSKVLTYLCSSRAILGVIPPANSVAEVLLTNQAGHVVDPAQRDMIAARVVEMLNDDEARLVMGKAGRRYAESEFSADRAATRFIGLFGAHLDVPVPSQPEASTVGPRPLPGTMSMRPVAGAGRHTSTTHRRRRTRAAVATVGGVVAALLVAVGLLPSSGPTAPHGVASAAPGTSDASQSTKPAGTHAPGTGSTSSGGGSTTGGTVAGAAANRADTISTVAARSSLLSAPASLLTSTMAPASASQAAPAPAPAPGSGSGSPTAVVPSPSPFAPVTDLADQVVASANSAVSATSSGLGASIPPAAPLTDVVGSLALPSL